MGDPSRIPRLGLAMGGGGARGLAHVGILTVLEEEGIYPTCIAGTSMGAIVGALYAESLDAKQVAAKVRIYADDPSFRASWEPFVRDEMLPENLGFFGGLRRSIQRKILSFKTFTSPAMQNAEGLLEPLQRLFSSTDIEDLHLPFAAVAVDLLSGKPHIFRTGNLVSAIYASSAVPAVFPPLLMENELLIDGGGPYRVPVNICRSLGADLVLGLDIPSFSPEKDEYKTGMDVLTRTDEITRDRLNRLVLREADIVVRPDVSCFHWANFGAVDPICTAGQEAMRAAIPELRRLLKERQAIRHRLRSWLRRLL
ncbi:MAG: patatin-like phospholipase family protein [Candidatus Eisenbacteria sp.]|nr:patatin-like phospholipase family protein [Candidatus Eisenbacteria bacterium]